MTLEDLAKLPEQLTTLQREMANMKMVLAAYVESIDDQIDTTTALKITGIKSRDTLTKERDRAGTLIRYCKHGTAVSYSRKSCIDYKLAKQIGQHRRTMWAAAS